MNNKCPYCGGKVKPPKVKKWETPSHAHGQCTECPRKPRAKVSWRKNETMYVSYSRDGRKPVSEYDRRNPITVRLSERNLDDGTTLTIRGKSYILKLYT